MVSGERKRQMACKPGSVHAVRRWVIIHLGCPLPEHLGATDPDDGPKSCLPFLPSDIIRVAF